MIGRLNERKIQIRDLNFRLIAYVLILSIIGILVVHSATVHDAQTTLVSTTGKQIMGVLGGIILMVICLIPDYRKLAKYSWIFYILSAASLVVVLFLPAIYGAHRWIRVPMLGTIQPSEFAKPALLLVLAFTVYKIGDRISKVYMLLLYFAVCAPILLLVLKEPDLSTSIVLILMIVTVLFLSGISYKWILAAAVLLLFGGAFFLVMVYQKDQLMLNKLLEPHQVERINGFFFPDAYPGVVYQQHTSVTAIGSGGLFGKGLNTSSLESVKNGHFLSEEQCDFIFAVVGEELGFAGCGAVILLIALITAECFRSAARCIDKVGRVIAAGAGAMIAFQSVINIGVALLLIPNTGIPLPLVSAGLSSLLSTYILIGLTLNVSLRGRQKKRVFY